jgi:DNA-binding CsgD family transcriptional regulator
VLPNPEISSIRADRTSLDAWYDGPDVVSKALVIGTPASAALQAALVPSSRFEGQLAAFSKLHRGAICIDNVGWIVAFNDLVEFGDGLRNEGRQLTCAFASDRVDLGRAIEGAYNRGHPPIRPVVVHRPSGKRPYLVDVIPVPGEPMADPGATRAVVLINDLEARANPRQESIQKAFDLTPREADLAYQLCMGATLQQAATAIKISKEHARQRLKVLMAKTGTSRQVDLLMLLGRIE